MALEKEFEYFLSIKKGLLKTHRDKYALIKGSVLVDTFTTGEEAYTTGVERFGTEPFLIKKITAEEEKESIPALSIGNLHAHP